MDKPTTVKKYPRTMRTRFQEPTYISDPGPSSPSPAFLRTNGEQNDNGAGVSYTPSQPTPQQQPIREQITSSLSPPRQIGPFVNQQPQRAPHLPYRRSIPIQRIDDPNVLTFGDENCFCFGRNICNIPSEKGWSILIAVSLLVFLAILLLINRSLTSYILPFFGLLIGVLIPSPIFAPKKDHTPEETEKFLELKSRYMQPPNGDDNFV